MQSAKRFFKVNLNITQQLVKDGVFKHDDQDLSTIPKGKGEMIKREGKRVAVYMPTQGEPKMIAAL